MLLVLLRHRLRLWRNQTFRGPRRLGRILALVFTLAAGLAFLGLVYRGSLGLFALLVQIDPALARPSLSILFAGVVSMGLFTGVGAVLYQLYLASDLDLLLAAPVSLRDLFLLKLVEASFATCGAAIMGLAALLGYAQAVGMPPSFLPLSLLIVGATILLTAALAMGIVMLAMRIVPARWAEGIVAILGGTLVAVVWLLFQTINVGGGAGRRGPPLQPSPEQLRDLEPLVSRWADATWWTPTAWAADALLAAGEGEPLIIATDLALLVGVTVVLVGLAYLVFQRTFYVEWGRLREVISRSKKVRRSEGPLHSLLRFLPASVQAIAIKDWKTLTRDLKLLSGLIMPIAVMVFFGFNSFRTVPTGSPEPGIFWMGMLPVALIPFILGAAISSRAFGLEGSRFALLRTAPLTAGRIVAAKFVASYLPILALTWAAALILGIWLGGSVSQIATALGVSAWLAAGSVAAYIGVGALATNFEEENPQKSVGCLGLLVSFVVSMLFLAANAGLFAWLQLSASGTVPQGLSIGEPLGLGLAATALASITVIAGLVWYGAKALEEWEGS